LNIFWNIILCRYDAIFIREQISVQVITLIDFGIIDLYVLWRVSIQNIIILLRLIFSCRTIIFIESTLFLIRPRRRLNINTLSLNLYSLRRL
jgi:hypothetical protein